MQQFGFDNDEAYEMREVPSGTDRDDGVRHRRPSFSSVAAHVAVKIGVTSYITSEVEDTKDAEDFGRTSAKKFRDQKSLKEKYEMKVCHFYDFFLEVANETSVSESEALLRPLLCE